MEQGKNEDEGAAETKHHRLTAFPSPHTTHVGGRRITERKAGLFAFGSDCLTIINCQ